MSSRIRLIQLSGPQGRRVAVVEEPQLRLLPSHRSILQLAEECLASGMSLQDTIRQAGSTESLSYDEIYSGSSDWRILPSVDHPSEPARCIVSGTGLTHLGSAANRQAMHANDKEVTDSMRMYRWGVEAGRPAPGQIGVAPEWFYKGSGAIVRAHGEPLTVPAHAEDGGEEPEIAGVYVIDQGGVPRRLGFTAGNEFSDHVVERKNYLYLAASKLRECSIGPELVIDDDFNSVTGEVAIERAGSVLWSKPIHTGEEVMSHSLANMEHHHFKFPLHRRPGDLHIHFFGADAFSFGEGITLQDGDVMQVRWDGLGRALRNPVTHLPRTLEHFAAKPL